MKEFRFKDKNIIIISPEPWDHVFVSKHHYALHLARLGNKVFFLNPPAGAFSCRPSGFPNLSIVNYRHPISGLRFLPALIRKSLMRALWKLIERTAGIRFDVVWSFDNSVFFDFGIFGSEVVTISHIVDLNQNFNTKTSASTASICFCTTDRIRQRLMFYNRQVFKINHGFNEVKSTVPVKLPGLNNIKAVYSGNLKMRFIDWQILYRVAEDHPDVDFVFIGPGAAVEPGENDLSASKEQIAGLQNVYWFGRVAADDLASCLVEADILLVTYQEKYHADQGSPHKVMEYLGSGRVVVATKTEEFSGYDELIQMSDRNDEFPKVFASVKHNLARHNSVALSEKRKSVARDNTYERQIARIEQTIYELRSR